MTEPQVKVYIRDEAYAWVPGSVVFVKDGQAFVRIELPENWHSTTVLCQDSGLEDIEDALMKGNGYEKQPSAFRAVSLALYPNNELPLQNECGNLSNMTDMPHLHEAALLYNLKERNSMGKPYAKVSDIIVAINPFERDENIYSRETRDIYASELVWNASSFEEEKKEDCTDVNVTIRGRQELVEPHVYEVSSLAYRGLALNGWDQTIVTTGESGSGKTETVKILLEHLVSIQECMSEATQQEHSRYNDLVDKVRQSSLVYEAFGNAKTSRNPNSSRFGRFTQLHFKSDSKNDLGHIAPCFLVGSSTKTVLIEKTRVTTHATGEKNFHIFYQLLAAPEEFRRQLWPFFAISKPENFSYLAQSGNCGVWERKDDELWKQTLDALASFDIQGNILKTIMEAVAIVLQLGNLQFGTKKIRNGYKTVVISIEDLAILSEMTGIARDILEAALTNRDISTSSEKLRAPQSPENAKEAVDGLAQEVYDVIFASIGRQMNEEMKPGNHVDVYGSIGLLDIYGFERLEVNQFEQLCINYANEQLQQKYVADNFKVLKTEFDEEGIDIFDFSLVDNSSVLNLLDGRDGIFVTLQEECLRHGGTYVSFLSAIQAKNNNRTSPPFILQAHYKQTEFGIEHFAGPVRYDATKFIARNTDRVPESLILCMAKTANNFIRRELQYAFLNQTSTSNADRLQKKSTMLEKFSAELRDILVAVELSQTRYIRCIIPNGTMSPRVTNHLMTLRQLESAGLMTAVALSRESFPDSMPYKTLLDRYSCIMKASDRVNMREMALADQIVFMLTNLFMTMFEEEDVNSASMPFACGKTKAYLRTGALEHLEAIRHHFFSDYAAVIQRWMRQMQSKRKIVFEQKMVVPLQALWRQINERRRFLRIRKACNVLSSWFKSRKQVIAEVEKRKIYAAESVQSKWRSVCCMKRYKGLKNAVMILQRKQRQRQCLDSPIDDFAKGIFNLIQRVSLRRDAMPHNRSAESLLLEDIESVLCDLSRERQSLLHNARALEGHVSQNKRYLHHQQRSEPECPASGIILWNRQCNKTKIKSPVAEPSDLQPELQASSEAITALTNDKESLMRERDQWRQQLEEMDITTNKLKANHEHMLKDVREECDREVATLKEANEEQKQRFSQEKIKMENMMKEAEDARAMEVDDLRNGILQAQGIQDELRGKIKELQAKHAEEREKIITELNDAALGKDLEIERLQEKCEKLAKNAQDEYELGRRQLQDAQVQHQREVAELKSELQQAKESQRRLTAELDELQTAHSEELEKRVTKTLAYDNKQAEIANLQNTIQEQKETLDQEREKFSKMLQEAEEKHKLNVSELKEEVFWGQESQRQLKSELSELQAVHAEELEKTKREALEALNEDSKIASLKDQLEQQEHIFNNEKDELCRMLREAEEKYQADLNPLTVEIRESKESYQKLRSESNKMEAAHAEELEKMMTEMLESQEREGEITKLKELLEEQERGFQQEKDDLYQEVRQHVEDVRALKVAFVETQEAHKDHLIVIMHTLESLEAEREEDMIEILSEFDLVRREKESKIDELEEHRAFEQSRQMRSSELSTIEEDVESTRSTELSSVRRVIEKHSSDMSKRSRDFNATLQKLQMAVKPGNMKYIMEKVKKQNDSAVEAKVFSEIHRMSKFLGDIYALEEHSQEEVNRTALALLDRVLAESHISEKKKFEQNADMLLQY